MDSAVWPVAATLGERAHAAASSAVESIVVLSSEELARRTDACHVILGGPRFDPLTGGDRILVIETLRSIGDLLDFEGWSPTVAVLRGRIPRTSENIVRINLFWMAVIAIMDRLTDFQWEHLYASRKASEYGIGCWCRKCTGVTP